MAGSIKLATAAAICAAFACAESWSGKLLDTTCIDQQKSVTCEATTATVTFAILVSGKTYLLDDAGNGKAVEAILAHGPEAPAAAGIVAKVNGQLEGDVIKVESIRVQ
jgi:hypothetical protein